MTDLVNLFGKTVEVMANDVTYAGNLVEVSETEVHLETVSGWIVILMDRVVDIREKETEG